jgi:L-alanine-DL-glutamate epimerase-like enolase superfamily enzyme
VAAPISVVHAHVHSMRVASGAEALVARVLAADGSAGFGFTLNLDAGVARDMAAWDALARKRKVPLYTLLGGCRFGTLALARDLEPAPGPDWEALRRALLERRYRTLRVDPFAWGSLEQVQTIAAAAAALDTAIALLAPNAHPWEIAYCAALGAAFPGKEPCIIVRGEPPAPSVAVSQVPGVGVDWSLEPGFAALRWVEPAAR